MTKIAPTTVISVLTWHVDAEADQDKRAHLFRAIEAIAADAAHKIERAQLEAGE